MQHFSLPAAVMVMLLASPGVAMAYVGPGAGITVIGTAIAFVGVLVLAIVGFLWYPIKRLLAKMKDRKNRKQADQTAPPP